MHYYINVVIYKITNKDQHTSVHVCICVYVCVCIYIYIYIYIYIHIYIYIYIYIHIYTYIYIYIYIYTHIYIYIYIYIYLYIYIYTYIYIYIYIYIYNSVERVSNPGFRRRAPLFEVRRVRFTHRPYWHTHLLHIHTYINTCIHCILNKRLYGVFILKKNCHIAGLKKELNADTILKNVLMLKMLMPLFFLLLTCTESIFNIFHLIFQCRTFLLSCAFESFCIKLCPLLRTGDIKW